MPQLTEKNLRLQETSRQTGSDERRAAHMRVPQKEKQTDECLQREQDRRIGSKLDTLNTHRRVQTYLDRQTSGRS